MVSVDPHQDGNVVMNETEQIWEMERPVEDDVATAPPTYVKQRSALTSYTGMGGSCCKDEI